MNDVKMWWQSKTVWAQIIAILFAIASTLKFDVGEYLGLSQEEFLAGVMTIIGIASIFFRKGATDVIVDKATYETSQLKSQGLMSSTHPTAKRSRK